ncbi:hydroxymethylglutaryl-CoA lyase [Bacillus testis]|uniref:hydroxymethylglutaryl-CoA lyase n=1 Tax=Bacillus testis TaxID=1622072 RepID=UPI00067F33C7|nr:hydroxymethylglutaryl-CoA lyase [Bacillus testis]
MEQKMTIREVGPRDGLQNEKEIISTEQKIQWINQLSDSGLSYIEITSFVARNWIPQLSDSLSVAKGIKRKKGVRYAALVPNLKGLEHALEADIDEVNVFMSASETHNQKNINKTISQTLPALKSVCSEATAAGKTLRGYVSTVFGCPYEGKVDIHKVLTICHELFSYGVDEISLGDTIGVANPRQVEDVLELVQKEFDSSKIAMHFHDTHGMALANILKSIDMGITVFDSSLGGLGGCPYAPGASGNVATDDVVHMLHQMGYKTGIDEAKLHAAAVFIQNRIRKPLRSHQMAISNSVK